jgi:uncharacterized membrane protein YfcA
MAIGQIIGDPILGGNLIAGVLISISSFLLGIAASALGIGGGFITTPSLILLGIEPSYAIGTVLIMIISIALSATIAYSRKKEFIEYKTGLLTAVFTVTGAILGSTTSSILANQAPDLFRIIFALFLIPIAIKMIVFPKRKTNQNADDEEIEHDNVIFFTFERREVLSAVCGLVAGFASGLLGIGGGVIMVPILVHIGKVSMHKAVATSMFIMIFTSIAGATIKISNGQVHPDLAIFLILGIIVGAQIGPKLVKKVDTTRLQQMFGFTMILALIIIAIGRDQFVTLIQSILSVLG